MVITNGGWAVDLRTDYARVTGLQVEMIDTSTSTENYFAGIQSTALPTGTTASTSQISSSTAIS